MTDLAVPEQPSAPPAKAASPHEGNLADGATLPAKLLSWAATDGDHIAMRKRDLGRWKTYTWAEYAERVETLALGLRELGVDAGDHVAILCGNRPAWPIMDLAVQGIGAVSVGIYPTSPAAEVGYILEHSGAVMVLCEDEEQIDKIAEIKGDCPKLEMVVVVDQTGLAEHIELGSLLTFEEIPGFGSQFVGETFPEMVAAIDEDDPAIIVYTSGTTGPPKAAMLSHRNLATAARSGADVYGVSRQDELLSYLPLCHVAERLLSVVMPVAAGAVVNYGGGIDDLVVDLADVQPTVFLGVPRVWEKMLATVETRIADASRLKRFVYRIFTRSGDRIADRRLDGRFGLVDRILFLIGWLVLYRPLRNKLGLRRVRLALSGAAPIAPAVLRYFWGLGVPIYEAYGQTENTAQATATRPGVQKIGSVGTAVPLAEVKIDEQTGEILTRGPGTFLGYYRDEAATAETFDDDGWLKTGDVGVMDDDGFLEITDRMKDLIITAGGKNISPSEIENRLKVSPYVREAVVIGDGRPFLTALIGVEADTVGDWCTRRRIAYTTYEDLSATPEVVELIGGIVEEVNADLARVEQIKTFRMFPKILDEDDGEITATQKVKRKAISELFTDLIEEMYR